MWETSRVPRVLCTRATPDRYEGAGVVGVRTSLDITGPTYGPILKVPRSVRFFLSVRQRAKQVSFGMERREDLKPLPFLLSSLGVASMVHT